MTILETIVRGLPWPATTNYIWNIPNATKYKQEGQVFCLHYVGRGRNLTSGGVETPKDVSTGNKAVRGCRDSNSQVSSFAPNRSHF